MFVYYIYRRTYSLVTTFPICALHITVFSLTTNVLHDLQIVQKCNYALELLFIKYSTRFNYKQTA